MRLKIKYQNLVLYLYIISMMSFVFLRCQDITSQELATAITLLIAPFVSKLFKSKGKYKKIVLAIMVYMAFEFFRSLIRYGQSISSVFYLSGELISLLLYFYFTSFDIKKRANFFDIIIQLYKISLIVLWIIALLYNLFGIKILDEIAYERLRYGNIKLYYGVIFVSIGAVLHFGQIIEKLNQSVGIKKREYAIIVLSILYYFYVVQSRMMIAVILCVYVAMYALCYKKYSKKIVFFMIGIILIVFITMLPSVQLYITENFGAIFAGTDSGTIPRLQAITHYVEAVENDRLFGMGFMDINSPSNGKYDITYILRGPWGVFYTDDVGIFGYYMMFGVFGLIIYACMLIKMFIHGFKERKVNPHKIGLAFYIALSSVSTTFFDIQRQAAFMLIFLCMDLECNKYCIIKKEKTEDEYGK